jgi:hypothetical protein
MAGQGTAGHMHAHAHRPSLACPQRDPPLPKRTEQWKRREISLARLAPGAAAVLAAMCKAPRVAPPVDAVDLPQKKGWGGAGGGSQPGGSACRLF